MRNASANHRRIHLRERMLSGHKSCVTLGVIDAAASNITIRHCREQHIYLFETSVASQPSVLIRIVGPKTIFTGFAKSVNERMQVFSYPTPYIGSYHAFVRLLMDDVPDNDVRQACMSTTPTVQHQFQVDSSTLLTRDHDHYCCWETNDTFENDWMQYANVLDQADKMTQRYSNISFNFPMLSDDTLSQCFINATACFFGDSQMRNLHNSIGKLKYKDKNDIPPELNAKIHTSTNLTTVFPGLKIKFTFMAFPNLSSLAAGAPELDYCTHNFYNFGQWPLGWPEGFPWSFQKLDTELNNFLSVVKQKAGLHHWVSTAPHPITYMQTSCPPTDWRILTHIDTFNERARSIIMSNHPTVAYVDTFHPMLHMHDFSFDNAHYQEPVGPDIARYVLSTVCPANTAL